MITNHGELIVLYLRGRLGNRMFQLALGNILAKCLERTLCVQGEFSLLSNVSYPDAPNDLDLKQCEILKGQIIDSEQIKKAQTLKKAIVLDGWFQRYSYYAPYKDMIINLYKEALFQDVSGGNDSDIVFHLRTTDYRKPMVRANYMKPLPLEYLMTVYRSRAWEKVYIVTDDKDDELVLEFQAHTNGNIISKTLIHDFNFIRNSKNIVLSTSTFSWWAGWLSDAKTIFFPRMGIWNPLLRPDVDLKVNEQRYDYRLGNSLVRDFWHADSSTVFSKPKQLRKFIQIQISI